VILEVITNTVANGSVNSVQLSAYIDRKLDAPIEFVPKICRQVELQQSNCAPSDKSSKEFVKTYRAFKPLTRF
jgi:hypothetical protein